MNKNHMLKLASCLLGLVLITGLEIALGQQAAQLEMKGVTIKPLEAINLGPEIEGMAGRNFACVL